jgi:hypothetical protein
MLKTTLLSFVLLGTLFADGPVLKTGQTTVYRAGDDGTYQAGIARSYTRNANGVVKDNATGLEWQDDVPSVEKKWVTQANYDAGNYDDTSGDTATTYCENLTLDGKSDWRAPTIEELVSITDKGRVNPSIDPTFQNVPSSDYWSSTTYAGGTSRAWSVNFDNGYDPWGDKDNNRYVRCVRSGQ